MADKVVQRFMQGLRKAFLESVLKDLMSGNDVGCFTTAQFTKARNEVVASLHVSLRGEPFTVQQSEHYLRAAPDYFREVSPGVWVPVNATEAKEKGGTQ